MQCPVCGSEFNPNKKQQACILRGMNAYCSEQCRLDGRSSCMTRQHLECCRCSGKFMPSRDQAARARAGSRVYCCRDCQVAASHDWARISRQMEASIMSEVDNLIMAARWQDDHCHECGGPCLPSHQRRRRAIDQRRISEAVRR